jgi:hypothetical protein
MAATYKAQAIRLGRDAGDNAAGWWIQENGGGRDTRSAAELAAWAEQVLDGIESGDPEVMDGLPAADLSGQWADGLTPARLAEAVGMDSDSDEASDRLSELCDAYENAFAIAAHDAIVKHLRGLVRAGRAS